MPTITGLNYINSRQISATTLDSNGNPIGGLSGITYNAATNSYYVISDGRNVPGSPGPARFYTVNLPIDPTTGNLTGVNIVGVTTIGNPLPFAPNVSDTEGIAFINGNVFISSEGIFSGSQPTSQPFINRFDLAGNQNLALPIPAKFAATAVDRGIRNNRAFESLSITPDQQFLFTATENALKQDGPVASAANGSRNRILRYNLTTGLADGEFLYNTDPVNGISELLALDDNTFLAIDRSLNPPFAGSFRLYEVSLLGATDISGLNALPNSGIIPVEKRLIADLTVDFGLLDNFEGMTLGPVLPDGRRSLILLSDNNFGAGFNLPSQFAAFAIRINNAPTLTPLSPNLPAIPEDPTTNNGELISAFVGSAIADVDPSALSGIAVTAVDNTNGTWEYSTDNGLNWTGFGIPSTAAARLLAADVSTKIRFVPNTNYNGTATITYQAWDQTRGSNGMTADISVVNRIGGITAFSTGSDTATLTVNAVADAPTLTVDSASGNENTPIPLNINAALVDIDGSENLSLQISNVPASAIVSAGTNLGGGIWQLTPDQLTGLSITSSSDNDFALTVTATATETSNSNTASTPATLNVIVNSSPTTPTPSPSPTPAPSPSPTPTPLSLMRNADNIFFVQGGNGQTQLQFTLSSGSKNAFVNEVGVFVVDDDQGTINGVVPRSAGYLETALKRSQVIFSALSDPPNNFGTTNQTRVLSVDSSQRLVFYLVQNNTTDMALADLAAGRTAPNVFFSSPLFNSDGFDSLRVSEPGTGVLTLMWEDWLGEGTQDFNDLVLNAQAIATPLILGAGLQGEAQQELIDLRGEVGLVQADFILNSEANFDNFAGLYKVADTTGGIDVDGNGTVDLRPGDSGYAQAAIQQRVTSLDLIVANNSTAMVTGQLEGGAIYAPFLIADGRPEVFLDENPSNDPAVYFPFLGANSDGVDHVRLLGDNTFGFEDLPSGGDRDFNDLVLQVQFT